MSNLKVTGKQEFMGLDIPIVLGGFGEGKKCVSDKTIAEVHSQPTYEIRRRIGDNFKRFVDNIDFIDMKQRMGESQTLDLLLDLGYAKQSITQAEHIYILSERGYAKLIKIMDTDLAWDIHDKLIDEYFELRESLSRPRSPLEQMKLQGEAILELDTKVVAVDRDLQQFKQDMPILGIEEDHITSAVRRKGVHCLGGKDSIAYHDRSLRSKVYADIYGQLKREFGVGTYKGIKRRQCDYAVCVIEAYDLPIVLADQIDYMNSQMEFDDILQ